MRFIDLTGRKFNRLTVVGLSHRTRPGMYFWTCACECGGRAVVAGLHLRSGNTTSCGCRGAETMVELVQSTTTHGMAGSRTYNRFHAMRRRCSDPRHKDFRLYGARGISVCDRWSGPDGFVRFVADMGEPPEGLTLDRIDVDGNYEPGNCRWATWKEQAANRRPRALVQ